MEILFILLAILINLVPFFFIVKQVKKKPDRRVITFALIMVVSWYFTGFINILLFGYFCSIFAGAATCLITATYAYGHKYYLF